MTKPVGHRVTKTSTAKSLKTAKTPRHPPPARTVDGREKQLVNLAINLSEKQLADGNASSQIIVHYLKLGTTIAELEKEKLKNENLLLEAKTASLKSDKNVEVLYKQALNAMRDYTGQTTNQSEDDDE